MLRCSKSIAWCVQRLEFNIQHQVQHRTNKDHVTLNNSPGVLTVIPVTVLWECVQASLPQVYKGKDNGNLFLKWLLSIGTLYPDKNHSESRVGMEAHHSLDYSGNFRVGGEEREKQGGRKKGEQRKGGRKNMTHTPCKYT